MKVYQWLYWTTIPQCWEKSQPVPGAPKQSCSTLRLHNFSWRPCLWLQVPVNATIHPSFHNILVNTLESTSFNGFWLGTYLVLKRIWNPKSLGFQILLSTKYVPSLVKIHWRMLILECSQGCYGRTVALLRNYSVVPAYLLLSTFCCIYMYIIYI
jgi:hypothetical protein